MLLKSGVVKRLPFVGSGKTLGATNHHLAELTLDHQRNDSCEKKCNTDSNPPRNFKLVGCCNILTGYEQRKKKIMPKL